MTDSPQQRVFRLDGKEYRFPADASDDEVKKALSIMPSPSAPPADTGSGNTEGPGGPGEFLDTLSSGVTGIPRSLLQTAKGLVTHPINTIGSMATNLSNTPEDLASDWETGHQGRALGNGLLLGAPAILDGLSSLTKRAARPFVNSALNLPGKAEVYGATPAKAVLEETHGVRPATIAESAQKKISELTSALENRSAAAKEPGLVTPALNVINSDITQAAAANSEATPRELAPMAQQLTVPRPGFTGATRLSSGADTPRWITPSQSSILGPDGRPFHMIVSPEQTPLDLLNMKRQFGQDFVRNWNPASQTKGALGTARRAYHEMAKEVNRVAPGAVELNQRISSLIPAAERARLTALEAGAPERILNRVARPTGGMFPALFGYATAGVPGLLGALAGQETLSSPTFKMLAARGIHAAGTGLGAVGEAAKLPAVTTPILRKRGEQPKP